RIRTRPPTRSGWPGSPRARACTTTTTRPRPRPASPSAPARSTPAGGWCAPCGGSGGRTCATTNPSCGPRRPPVPGRRYGRAVTTIVAARVVCPDRVVEPGIVELDGDRIATVAPVRGPVPERTLVPGFVDLQ